MKHEPPLELDYITGHCIVWLTVALGLMFSAIVIYTIIYVFFNNVSETQIELAVLLMAALIGLAACCFIDVAKELRYRRSKNKLSGD